MENSERNQEQTHPKTRPDWLPPLNLDFEKELRRKNIATAIEIYGEQFLEEMKKQMK